MVLGDDDAADRAYCTRNNVWYCEPGSPYAGSGRCYHPHAAEVRDSQESGWPAGDTVRSRCPVCGTTWTHELPQ
jgi:hypothetical protein